MVAEGAIVRVVEHVAVHVVLEKLTVPSGAPETVNVTGAALPVKSVALIATPVLAPASTFTGDEAESEKVVATGGGAAVVVTVEPCETPVFPLASCELARN